VAMSYLAALGVDPTRMQTVSYGKERPAVTGSGEEVWAQNRRAMIVFK
jgi:peptidoglycan-associated lipoprotein